MATRLIQMSNFEASVPDFGDQNSHWDVNYLEKNVSRVIRVRNRGWWSEPL